MRKQLTSLLLLFTLLIASISFNSVPVSADSLTYNYTYSGGLLHIVGTHSSKVAGQQICLLVLKNNGQPLTQANASDNVIWIDQFVTGVNGAFTAKFSVAKDLKGNFLAGQEVVIRGGGSAVDNAVNIVYKVQFSGTLNDVKSNSILVGRDVYELNTTSVNGNFFTTKNIQDSMRRGGNFVYFKMGNYWYDLLNPKADSSSFLVPANAMTTTEVNALNPDIWYRSGSNPIQFDR